MPGARDALLPGQTDNDNTSPVIAQSHGCLIRIFQIKALTDIDKTDMMSIPGILGMGIKFFKDFLRESASVTLILWGTAAGVLIRVQTRNFGREDL